MIQFWKSVRLMLLVGVLGSTLWVLQRAIATPKTDNKAAQLAYSLPSDIPIRGWELQASKTLNAVTDLPAGRQYQYRQQAKALDIKARMVIGDGNISRLLFVYTPIRSANSRLEIKNRREDGFYGVLSHKGQAYLSACVNSRGKSTVTEPQFMQNRYTYDLQVGRVLPWILGQEPLLDQRCLWTLMSMPLPNGEKTDAATTEAAFKTLETAWFSWHHWWELHFPSVQAQK